MTLEERNAMFANADIFEVMLSGDEGSGDEGGPLLINESDSSSGIVAPDSGSDSDVIFVEPAPTQVSVLPLTDLLTPDIFSIEPQPRIVSNREILSRYTDFGPMTPLIRPPVNVEQINANRIFRPKPSSKPSLNVIPTTYRLAPTFCARSSTPQVSLEVSNPNQSNYSELETISEKLVHFTVAGNFDHFRAREDRLTELSDLLEYGIEIPELDSFLTFIKNLTKGEFRTLISRRNLNSVLSPRFRHRENSDGISYCPGFPMCPLYFSILSPSGKVDFLRSFGDSKQFKAWCELAVISLTVAEIILKSSPSLFLQLLTDFPQLVTESSDNEIFFLFFTCAVEVGGTASALFSRVCETFNSTGAIITKYWVRGRHSPRIMANRANQIRCSDVYFLDSVIAYYS